MDVELEAAQDGFGGLNEPVEVVPPAMAGQFLGFPGVLVQ
jgi:hypothetical protein